MEEIILGGSHLQEAFSGIAPHLYSLQGVRRVKPGNWVRLCAAARYLFAHGDLHDGVADESFSQISVGLLFEALHVHACFFHMFTAINASKSDTQFLHKTLQSIHPSIYPCSNAFSLNRLAEFQWYQHIMKPKAETLGFLFSSLPWLLVHVTHLHSAVFSLTVSSPSTINSSSSLSRASLCSGASWPKSLLVMPFKEKVRTIWTAQESSGLLLSGPVDSLWLSENLDGQSEGSVLFLPL